MSTFEYAVHTLRATRNAYVPHNRRMRARRINQLDQDDDSEVDPEEELGPNTNAKVVEIQDLHRMGAVSTLNNSLQGNEGTQLELVNGEQQYNLRCGSSSPGTTMFIPWFYDPDAEPVPENSNSNGRKYWFRMLFDPIVAPVNPRSVTIRINNGSDSVWTIGPDAQTWQLRTVLFAGSFPSVASVNPGWNILTVNIGYRTPLNNLRVLTNWDTSTGGYAYLLRNAQGGNQTNLGRNETLNNGQQEVVYDGVTGTVWDTYDMNVSAFELIGSINAFMNGDLRCRATPTIDNPNPTVTSIIGRNDKENGFTSCHIPDDAIEEGPNGTISFDIGRFEGRSGSIRAFAFMTL